MEQRRVGRSGLRVSAIALGTVSLGADYGIRAPGASGIPDGEDARQVLRHAFARGVTLFDTAPAYGTSEALLGDALGGEGAAIIATKVSVPRTGTDAELRTAIHASVAESCRRLRRARLDVVQIHNATLEVLARGVLASVLREFVERGVIGQVGASVYTEDEALAAIDSGAFSVLQVAYNLLDRRMAPRAFPAAQRAGVGVLVRSAYLKGALTEKAAWLPPELAALKAAVDGLLAATQTSYASLPSLAIRFALANPAVSSVLVGARTEAELDIALDAAAEPALDAATLRAIDSISVADERLLNPATWPLP